MAQKTNAKQEAPSLNDACRNSSRVVHGLATTGHVVNCKNISNPQTAISGPSVECKYTLPKNCHQDASEDTAKTVSGKWYRSNSVPAGETGSEGLEGGKNQVNVTLHRKLDSKKSPFKRHLSESFAQTTSVFAVEQKNRKCSQEEIERKNKKLLHEGSPEHRHFLKMLEKECILSVK